MANEFDISAYSRERQLVLLAEVTLGKGTSEDQAISFRRNLLTHKLLGHVPFFLLANRNAFYLWKSATAPDGRPDFNAAAKPVLKKYLGALADSANGAGPESLQFAVKHWLGELASGIQKPDPRSEPDKMLIESGLFERIAGGEICSENR